ncbi:Helix-turn-helix domain-containing protein [Desulfonispora thiosulfatigenes DSM 11270]|uniref:Helix-turn-helix domain-containing protein n=1 Tax=Desulfonispora thiosulfatigenes DSM 11270 TaxID=656914 RepID=A0A1W1VQ94_DESTI|nr:helix-turn-helix transcriptional regulator [Desulfonispora thiosulfatigenes]SMB95552.1 Helix-turn-helix domain-containing protein [Desulfonispora thiosulfatigenes DSM 11270]
MQLGEIIKNYRKQNDLSLREFANRCDLSHAYIAKLEDGIDHRSGKKVEPTLDTVKRISDAINIPMERLLSMIGYINKETNLDSPHVPQEYEEKHKITKRDLDQYEDFVEHAGTFFMNDEVAGVLMSTLGDKLRSLREDKNLKQIELAEKFKKHNFNITSAAISQYESNKRVPDTEMLAMYADLFNVSLDWLCGRTNVKNPDIKETITNRPYTDPKLDDLLKKVPDLTEEEKESLADHMEFAMKIIEKERERRKKF